MDLRTRAFAALSGQLSHPHGLPGGLVGRMLNRGNRGVVAAAADALEVRPGAVLADIGFGGGVGIELLLRRDGRAGKVHGVDVSATMIAAAQRRFRREIGAGRLVLHNAAVEQLPLDDAGLDGAITLNTLYFVTDLPTALSEMARVLKADGRLVIGLGDHDAMGRMPFTAHGFTLRPIDQVVDALGDAGLLLEEHRRVGSGDGAFHLILARPIDGSGRA